MTALEVMRLQPGDHVCSVYETEEQLVTTVARFLADGLARGERCWYVPSGPEIHAVRRAIEQRGIDVDAQTRRTALHLLDSNDTYTVRGGFDPEQTMRVFSEAIEQALTDGFTGFRAAAEMSWALQIQNGAESLIAYEALLRVLFSTARATGLCLYDGRRMPIRVVNGALLTHPFVASDGEFRRNAAYDPAVRALADVDPTRKAPRRQPEPSTR
jgi:chemotaxis family two-component system sensor kinase Cph1